MTEFVGYLREVLSVFGPIDSRAMFGGYGLYHQGLMFGLVADDELYLKVDAQTRPQFEREGLSAFEYMKNGKPFTMSYHKAPDNIFDEPDAALYWAKLGFNAAQRAALKKHKN